MPSERNIDYAQQLWWTLGLTRAVENATPLVVADWAQGRYETTYLAAGQAVRSVQYTSGAAGIYDPSHRPDLDRIIHRLPRGEPGTVVATIDRSAVAAFRHYRTGVGLLPPAPGP